LGFKLSPKMITGYGWGGGSGVSVGGAGRVEVAVRAGRAVGEGVALIDVRKTLAMVGAPASETGESEVPTGAIPSNRKLLVAVGKT
jgi:hypothetical protein